MRHVVYECQKKFVQSSASPVIIYYYISPGNMLASKFNYSGSTRPLRRPLYVYKLNSKHTVAHSLTHTGRYTLIVVVNVSH